MLAWTHSCSATSATVNRSLMVELAALPTRGVAQRIFKFFLLTVPFRDVGVQVLHRRPELHVEVGELAH